MATEMMRVMDSYQGGKPARICIRGSHWDVEYNKVSPPANEKSRAMLPLLTKDIHCTCNNPDRHTVPAPPEFLSFFNG